MAEREDPFDQLRAAVETTLDFVGTRLERATEEQATRAEQLQRLEAVKEAIDGPLPKRPRRNGGGGVWTPERRQAASERMKKQQADRAAERAQQNGHDGAAPLEIHEPVLVTDAGEP